MLCSLYTSVETKDSAMILDFHGIVDFQKCNIFLFCLFVLVNLIQFNLWFSPYRHLNTNDQTFKQHCSDKLTNYLYNKTSIILKHINSYNLF